LIGQKSSRLSEKSTREQKFLVYLKIISSQIYFNFNSEYEKIRDVVAFSKTVSAQDLMIDSPGEVNSSQLNELGIKIVE